jgi:hypothetical protein
MDAEGILGIKCAMGVSNLIPELGDLDVALMVRLLAQKRFGPNLVDKISETFRTFFQ